MGQAAAYFAREERGVAHDGLAVGLGAHDVLQHLLVDAQPAVRPKVRTARRDALCAILALGRARRRRRALRRLLRAHRGRFVGVGVVVVVRGGGGSGRVIQRAQHGAHLLAHERHGLVQRADRLHRVGLLLRLVHLLVLHGERVQQRVIGQHRLQEDVVGPRPRLRRARLARDDRCHECRHVSSRRAHGRAEVVDDPHAIVEVELQAADEERNI